MNNEETFSFHCNACGKCCNSPPAMTVEELFHHQDRFIGCLTIRLVERPTAATRMPGTREPLDPDDLAEWQALVDATSFALPGDLPPHLRIELGTQGYEHPIFDNRCPSLADDGRCSIHDDRKPAMCSAVPLEPALPDGLQRVVLRRRKSETGWMGAACIAAGEPLPARYTPTVRGRQLVQTGDRAAIATRRRQMRDETVRWGSPVFELLADELGRSVRQGALRPGGYLALSMAPLLTCLAPAPIPLRHRRYIEHQAALIDATVARAVARGHKAHRAATATLRRFLADYKAVLEPAPA